MKPSPSDKPIRWVPLAGDLEIESDLIRFRGREYPIASTVQDPPKQDPTSTKSDPPPRGNAAIGLVKSSQAVSDGFIRATVRFASVSDRTCCELALVGVPDGISQLPARPSRLFTAGLGAGGSAFGIREFGPRVNAPSDDATYDWRTLRFAGDRTFLKPDRDYEVELSFAGSQLRLSVDQVPVLTANSTALPVNAWNAGAFFLDYDVVTISDIKIHTAKPKAFVVMRLDGKYEDLYNYVIKDVCEGFDVRSIKADEISQPGLIIDDISRQIEQSRLIVADISAIPDENEEVNANVFFEVGYAYALRKPVILLAREGTLLPFDVRSFRVLFYENTIGGKARLDESLRKYVNEILSGGEFASRSDASAG